MGEKGKYTLDDFFRVQVDVALPGNKTITVRSLSDAEGSLRSEYATEMAKKTKNNIDMDSIREQVGDMEISDVLDSIRLVERMFASQKLYADTSPEIIIVPDGASLDERIEVKNQRDEARKKWADSIEERAEEEAGKIIAAIDKKDEDFIRDRLVSIVVESKAREAFMQAYEDMSIFLSTKIFKSVEDVASLNRQVRPTLISAINEVAGVDIWDLENFFATGSSQDST